MKNNRLLFIYDYFYPAYKAGGPIQSLVNATALLSDDYDIFIYTSCYDLNSNTPLKGLLTDQWVEVILPNSNKAIMVWYNQTKGYSKAIKKRKFSCIYLNGIFTFNYVVKPLLYSTKKIDTKLIIAPRGMLQEGALASKPLKKKTYLTGLKLSSLLRKVTWHATDQVEAQDIRKQFGYNASIQVVPNIPKKPLQSIGQVNKAKGTLRLAYISLIAAKKNLYDAIKAVQSSAEHITLDIYGPIKDQDYWAECEKLLASTHTNNQITYKGDVLPANVQSTFASYDAGIFLTKGENFGHALYECLSVGRPIITSHFTPWNNLEHQFAGWNVDINAKQNIVALLDTIAMMDTNSFEQYCNGAHQLASNHYQQLNARENYKSLFSF